MSTFIITRPVCLVKTPRQMVGPSNVCIIIQFYISSKLFLKRRWGSAFIVGFHIYWENSVLFFNLGSWSWGICSGLYLPAAQGGAGFVSNLGTTPQMDMSKQNSVNAACPVVKRWNCVKHKTTQGVQTLQPDWVWILSCHSAE